MNLEDRISKYIDEEKRLSEYKVSLLKSGEAKPYKDRLIFMEQDFLNFDFLKIKFSSLDDARKAVLMFKTSREDFELKYGDSKKKSLEEVSSQEFDYLKNKFLFIKEKYEWILNTKIKEINIVDDTSIRSLLKNHNVDYSKISFNDIKKIETSYVSKYRARIQILLYCLARYLFSGLKKIENNILEKSSLSYEDLRNINIEIFNLFEDYNKYIYQYFNIAKADLPPIIQGTIGFNDYISDIHPLKNISSDICEFQLNKISKQNIFDKNGLIIKKRKAERCYGINTNIKRIGNESIDLLYLEIYTDSGIEISDIFQCCFYNNNINGEYIKSIPTIPLWNLVGKKDDRINNIFSSIMKNNLELDPQKTNKGLFSPIKLSKNNSTILVAETRSDSEHLKDSANFINLIVNSIKKEYQSKFNYFKSDNFYNSEIRKKALKSYLGERNVNE